MGKRAREHRRPDRSADAGRRGRGLALNAQRARLALALLALVGVAAASGGLAPAAEPAPAAVSTSFDWRLPAGFPTPHVPADNPMSAAKVALGRRLFFDTRLSVNGSMSCASCHDPARAFSDGRRLPQGATGEQLPRNAMPLVNLAYYASYGWADREVRSLEAQMERPLFNEHPIELGLRGREAEIETGLRADETYASAFRGAFPAEEPAVSLGNVIRAIAAFERTLIFGRSAFDRHVFEGRHDAMSPDARRGMALFFSARLGCAACHSGFNFSGPWVDRDNPGTEPNFAENGLGAGPTRVPTLRNVALTGPYMHDGRFDSLDEVIAHYERAGNLAAKRPGARRASPGLARFVLTPDERRELVAFLEALTDTGS